MSGQDDEEQGQWVREKHWTFRDWMWVIATIALILIAFYSTGSNTPP